MMAHKTRIHYYESLETVSDWKKEIAEINRERMGFSIEIPFLDYAVVSAYRIMGGEHLWIPRVLSSLFWIVGGIFLYLIAEKILSSGAALFSTVFYLFLPFGISASRSFQPDPLMIMLLLFSIFMILKYNERSSIVRLIIAAASSSMAMIIKPYSIFLIYGAFISLALHKQGIRKLFTDRGFLIFIFLSPLPGAAYYISGLLTQGSYLQEHAQGSFLPHLLLKKYFWKDWFAMILRVIGLISLTGAVLGIFVIRNGLSRVLLIGLWIGYFIYGLFFTFHMHTHDYYQLQFIPVVALSLGTPGALLLNRLYSSKKGVLILSVFCMVLLLGFGINFKKVQQGGYSRYVKIFGYVTGINPQFYKFMTEDFDKEKRILEEIGEIVQHNKNTVFLTADFGRSLAYHGELSGLPWPTTVSFLEWKDRKIKIVNQEELFNGRYFTLRARGRFVRYTPDYFIITDFEEFEKQPDLKEFLNTNFPEVSKSKNYLIYDTGKMSKAEDGHDIMHSE
jgi:hypothetical protein